MIDTIGVWFWHGWEWINANPGISGVVATIIVLVIGWLFKVPSKIIRFLKQLCPFLKARQAMHKKNKDWKHLSPLCTMIAFSPIRIVPIGNKYRIEATIRVTFQSRDERNDTNMTEDDIVLYIHSKHEGRETGFIRHDYQLLCAGGRTLGFRLSSLDPLEKTYEFSRPYERPPLLERKVRCIFLPGRAYVCNVDTRALPKIKFKNIVVWEQQL